MSFLIKTEILQNIVKLTLEGELDSSTAPKLHEEVQKIIPIQPNELVMDLEKLNFMSSAGLRVIIFAKQKLGSAAKLILVKPQEQVVETLRMTGLIFSVTIVDKYPE
ncbi:MAG TPA: STAS domain-containing protein [Prolixibacteraceae bacterium]|nr:STAS domain-containing protein [Prolixibacteraceae bacterium]